VASGLSAHLFAAVTSIGSSLTQNEHLNYVRPLKLGMAWAPYASRSANRALRDPPWSAPSAPFRNFGSKAALQPFVVMRMEEVINRVMGMSSRLSV
jgi:hypothetical protein